MPQAMSCIDSHASHLQAGIEALQAVVEQQKTEMKVGSEEGRGCGYCKIHRKSGKGPKSSGKSLNNWKFVHCYGLYRAYVIGINHPDLQGWWGTGDRGRGGGVCVCVWDGTSLCSSTVSFRVVSGFTSLHAARGDEGCSKTSDSMRSVNTSTQILTRQCIVNLFVSIHWNPSFATDCYQK